MKKFISLSMLALVAVVLAGCSTEPTSQTGKDNLQTNVDKTMARLYLQDPSLKGFLESSYAYAVFPTVGEGGLIVGGAYGKGVVYKGNTIIGYADISKATVGAQIGGQSFAEVISFQDENALMNFEKGQLKFTAEASAVALKSGAAAATHYSNGVAIFIEPKEGLMAQAAIGGQSFSYLPVDAAANTK